MKLAIGLFVITQFALAQGPSPAPCDRAPAARPNGQPAAGWDAPLARPTRHRPRTSQP